jgi:hypothetical protein
LQLGLSLPVQCAADDRVSFIVKTREHSKEQRDALIALDSGQHGGTYWEIFGAVCPNLIEALFAPITLNVDREKRCATIRIPGIAESNVEPIKNPATVSTFEMTKLVSGHVK